MGREKKRGGWLGGDWEDGGCEVVTEEEIPTQNAAQTWPPASCGELRLAGFPLELDQLAYLRVWQGFYIMMRICKSSCFKPMEVMSGAEQGGASWSMGNQ